MKEEKRRNCECHCGIAKKKKSKLLLEKGRTDVWFVKSLWALCLGLIVLISSLLDVIQ